MARTPTIDFQDVLANIHPSIQNLLASANETKETKPPVVVDLVESSKSHEDDMASSTGNGTTSGISTAAAAEGAPSGESPIDWWNPTPAELRQRATPAVRALSGFGKFLMLPQSPSTTTFELEARFIVIVQTSDQINKTIPNTTFQSMLQWIKGRPPFMFEKIVQQNVIDKYFQDHVRVRTSTTEKVIYTQEEQKKASTTTTSATALPNKKKPKIADKENKSKDTGASSSQDIALQSPPVVWMRKVPLLFKDFIIPERTLGVRVTLKSEQTIAPLKLEDTKIQLIRIKSIDRFITPTHIIEFARVIEGKTKHELEICRQTYEIEVEVRPEYYQRQQQQQQPMKTYDEWDHHICGDLILRCFELQGLGKPFSIAPH